MTPLQPQQTGCIDNKIRRKRITEWINESVNYEAVCLTAPTMLPSWKLFPLSKLHDIELLKSYMEATTTRRVDQLWTKEDCSSHSQNILGKVKTACQGCGLHDSSGGSLEWQLKPWDSQHIVPRLHWYVNKIFMNAMNNICE